MSGSGSGGGGLEHQVKSNKRDVGNFDKRKRKELFVNEIEFSQMVYLILPLNRNKVNSNSF